jgi:hypothetical protein
MNKLEAREGQIFEPQPQPQQGWGIFATHR